MHNRKRLKPHEIDEKKKKAKEQTKIKYMGLKGMVLKEYEEWKKDQDKVEFEKNMDSMNKLLMICPDFYSLWNFRKQLIDRELKKMDSEEKKEKILQGELHFTQGILCKRDLKSYGTWHHRAWTITQAKKFWENEPKVIALILKMDLRNFHCWNYRRYFLEISKSDPKKELEFIDALFEHNPSNYSGWHNRAALLRSSKEEDQEEKIGEEFELCQNMFYTDPGDQSAWMYHRWLLDEDTSLYEQDNEICHDLLEMAQEDEDQDRNSKWPLYTLLLNKIKQHERLSEETQKDLLEKYDQLIKIDPKRSNYYLDMKSDFIVQQSTPKDGALVLPKQELTRYNGIRVFTDLKRLDFSHNKIIGMARFVPQHFLSLHELILDHNSIVQIEGLNLFPNLKHLSLNHNKICVIADQGKHANSIEVLELQGNPLVEQVSVESLKAVGFVNLKQLKL